VPDPLDPIDTLGRTAQWLLDRGVSVRLDPVLAPIGVGFANSLVRYRQIRLQWPTTPMMMGVGNLTELSEVDSAGVNLLLAAICEEWSIHSVLTTQVINWARTSVRELDVARRLVRYAVEHAVPPKHIDSKLVTLRDPDVLRYNDGQLLELSRRIQDHNYRIFVQDRELVVLGGGELFRSHDAFELFDQLFDRHASHIDASHAFYLGFELCKAAIARQLDKDYRQDESLNWGYLTEAEPERHRLRRRRTDD
jgi:dihydropteroate synthase